MFLKNSAKIKGLNIHLYLRQVRRIRHLR